MKPALFLCLIAGMLGGCGVHPIKECAPPPRTEDFKRGYEEGHFHITATFKSCAAILHQTGGKECPVSSGDDFEVVVRLKKQPSYPWVKQTTYQINNVPPCSEDWVTEYPRGKPNRFCRFGETVKPKIGKQVKATLFELGNSYGTNIGDPR